MTAKSEEPGTAGEGENAATLATNVKGAPPAQIEKDTGETPSPSSALAGDASIGLPEGFAMQMPEVQEHAIAQHNAESQKAESEAQESPGFDPAIHLTGADGKPVKTKTGKFRKKPGRPASNGKAASTVYKAESAEKSPEALKREQAHQTGKFAAGALIQLGVTIGGDEWMPTTVQTEGGPISEQAGLEYAFGNYFESQGLTDIPPGIALAIAVGGYALPRFTKPKTKSQLGKLKDFIGSKYLAWRSRRKQDKKPQNDTKDDSEA